MRTDKTTFRRAPKPAYQAPKLADLVLLSGQRLRAAETATPTTFSLPYAAKWAQGKGRGLNG